jgi:hypothetical protein
MERKKKMKAVTDENTGVVRAGDDAISMDVGTVDPKKKTRLWKRLHTGNPISVCTKKKGTGWKETMNWGEGCSVTPSTSACQAGSVTS